MNQTSKIVTAGMVAIGDELLSGRTKDRNIAYLADFLSVAGIDLKEVRIVGDEQPAIVDAVNALRDRYDYVFTSGGIGPTHDDITADAIGAAMDLPVEHHREAMQLMGESYASRGMEFTESRKRMARMPRGATLIANLVSMAPGFTIANVHVMAGVPSIFQAMLESLAPTLQTGAKMYSRTIECPFGEGAIGKRLSEIQKSHPETAIGSYPRFDGKNYSTQIVVRARDETALAAAEAEARKMVDEISASDA